MSWPARRRQPHIGRIMCAHATLLLARQVNWGLPLDLRHFGTRVYKPRLQSQPAGLSMTKGSPVSPSKDLGRILLVDDDFAILDGVAEFLECEGFSVVSASNGLDALNQLRSGLHVDAIVLDVMMPMMDVWDFRAH